jgi:hypothetical protein
MPARQRVCERMAIVEHAASAAIGHHRRGEPFGERAHLLGGVERAAADEDHRTLRFRQQIGGALDRVLVELRRAIERQRGRHLDLGARRQDVGRKLHADRPRPTRLQRLERARDDVGTLLRCVYPFGRFGQPAQDADLVGNFVQEAMTFADATARDLADEREDARAGRIGGGERRGAVEKTGTGHHGVGGGFAGRECGAECHVGGALFVPGMHHGKRVAGVEHGVEQMIALDAGQGIDGGDAVREDGAHDGIATTHQRHASLSDLVAGNFVKVKVGLAANSVRSLPPCGGGRGRGVVVVARSVSVNCHPHPNPSPQGGGEHTVFAALSCTKPERVNSTNSARTAPASILRIRR